MENYVVGIDIGSSKICTAAGRITKRGELQIIGITSSECKGLKKSIVVNIDKTAESIKKCIEKLEVMLDIQIKDVYIALPGSICELIHNKSVIAVSSDDREIKKRDVDRVIESTKLISLSSDKEIIGVEPQQFIVDGYDNIKDPIGMSGMRLEAEVQVVTAQSTIVNNLIKCVSKAGFTVKGMSFEPKAVSSVVLQVEEKELGCALVDIGAETIDITVIKNDNISYVDSLALGGNSITNDIALGMKIPFNEAEKIKLKYGNIQENDDSINEKLSVKLSYNETINLDYNFLKLIIKSRIEELYELIKRKLVDSGYYKEIANVIIVGGGIALIKGAVESGSNIMGKSLRIGTPNYVGASNPMYASAVGIVNDICLNRNIIDDDFNYDNDENEMKSFWNKGNKKSQEDVNIFSKVKEFFTDLF